MDFWAAWCGPCRSFTPLFEAAAAASHTGSVRFASCYVDASPGTAELLQIRSVPTLVDEIGRSLGAVSRGDLDATIRQLNALTRSGDLPAGRQLRTVTGGAVAASAVSDDVHLHEDAADGLAEGASMSQTFTIYSTPWCGYCKRLMSQLDREGIAYTSVDIERDEAAAQFVMKVNGGRQTVPTVVFADGSAATNPSLKDVLARVSAA